MNGMDNKKIAKKEIKKILFFFSRPHGLSILLIELEIGFKRKRL